MDAVSNLLSQAQTDQQHPQLQWPGKILEMGKVYRVKDF